MTDIKNPKNPNDWIKEMIIFLISLFIVILFQNSIYADTTSVTNISITQIENSSDYCLKYDYNGCSYEKTIKGLKSDYGFVVYQFGTKKIIIQQFDKSKIPYVDSSINVFYRSNSTASTVTVNSCEIICDSSTVTYTISSKSSQTNKLDLSSVTFLLSSVDIVDSSTGDLFFPLPPQVTILTGVTLTSPLVQVVGLIPIVLFWAVFYLSLRKGLTLLSTVLKKS